MGLRLFRSRVKNLKYNGARNFLMVNHARHFPGGWRTISTSVHEVGSENGIPEMGEMLMNLQKSSRKDDYHDALLTSPEYFSQVNSLDQLVGMLEAAALTQDDARGALLFHYRWQDITTLKLEDLNELNLVRQNYLLRAVNAILQLQCYSWLITKHAFHCPSLQRTLLKTEPLKDWQRTAFSQKVIEDFNNMSVSDLVLKKFIVPDSDSIMWALVLACVSNDRDVVFHLLRQIVYNGSSFHPYCLTRWARYCSYIHPTYIAKTIWLVRGILQTYKVKLTPEELQDLVDVEWEPEALVTLNGPCQTVVRALENLLEQEGLLETQEGWSVLIAKSIHLRSIKDIDFLLGKMAARGFKPDLSLYKAIVKELIAMGTHEAYIMATFHFWREFMSHFPLVIPDVELVNQMIYCCRQIRDVDRAYYYVSVLHQCRVKPVMETFRLLLLICCEARDEELFERTVRVALKVFPKKKTAIRVMAARYLAKWKEYVDTEMAYTVIAGIQKKQTKEGDCPEADMAEIAGSDEDIMSDLKADDSDHVKAIVSSYSREKNNHDSKDHSNNSKDNEDDLSRHIS